MVATYGMTYAEIIAAANSLTHEAMTNAEAVIWLNAWLGDMAKHSTYTKEATITLVAGTTAYDIPDDCREIQAVLYLQGGSDYRKLDKVGLDDKESEGWKVVDGHLVAQELDFTAGEVLCVVYFARFATIAVDGLSAKPTQIPAEYHNSGTFYVANRHEFREKWQDEANWLYALYLSDRNEYEAQQQDEASTGRIAARVWR